MLEHFRSATPGKCSFLIAINPCCGSHTLPIDMKLGIWAEIDKTNA